METLNRCLLDRVLDRVLDRLLNRVLDCEKWEKFTKELLGPTTTVASTRSNASKKSPAVIIGNRDYKGDTPDVRDQAVKKEYRAGKIAAYADNCGMYTVSQRLFEFFGRTTAYRTGYDDNYKWTNNDVINEKE